MTTWLSEGGCGKCNSCGMDMDLEPFCVNEDVLALRTAESGKNYPWGLDIGVARPICKGSHWTERKPNEFNTVQKEENTQNEQYVMHFTTL